MPQYERRLYEPSDEPRVFDGGDDLLPEDEGSRLPLLIVIALVVLVSFAGVVWIAYTQGVERGREDAPRVLAAEQERVPAPPKQQTDPYANLSIYKSGKPGADAERQVPASPIVPERKNPPEVGEAASPAANTPAKAGNAVQGSANPAGAVPLKPSAAAQEKTTVMAKPAPPLPAPKSALPGSRSPAATGAPRSITPPAAQPKTAPPSVARPIQPGANPAAPPAMASGPGGYVLQIGSYTSEAEATASWQSYRQSHPAVAGYAPDIKSADLGKRGTWYRLRIGPFGSLAEASAACAKLKAQGASCLPARQ